VQTREEGINFVQMSFMDGPKEKNPFWQLRQNIFLNFSVAKREMETAPFLQFVKYLVLSHLFVK